MLQSDPVRDGVTGMTKAIASAVAWLRSTHSQRFTIESLGSKESPRRFRKASSASVPARLRTRSRKGVRLQPLSSRGEGWAGGAKKRVPEP